MIHKIICSRSSRTTKQATITTHVHQYICTRVETNQPTGPARLSTAVAAGGTHDQERTRWKEKRSNERKKERKKKDKYNERKKELTKQIRSAPDFQFSSQSRGKCKDIKVRIRVYHSQRWLQLVVMSFPSICITASSKFDPA